jgi:DNA-binding NarL/FixJ family response regulator
MDELAEPILVLVRDLMFSSRISATARAADRPVRMLRDPSELREAPGRRLIVDLNQPGALEAAVDWKLTSSGDVVGFVSHVDADTIARARAAGIDRVLPRSRFVEVLPELLA